MDLTVFLVVGVVFAVVFGVLGQYIAIQKDRDGGEGFLLGFLFGPLGVFVEACMPVGQARETREREAAAEASAAAQRSAKLAAEVEQCREEKLRRTRQKAQEAALRAEQTAARRAERDKAYRAMGIEPGPWAWYQALPEVQQAIVLGLAFGLPAGAILIAVFAIPKLLGAP
jgi:hypothetical protein